MIVLFQYNWQVREEWFDCCKQLSEEELLRPREGGVGSILATLLHIVDVEQSWIRGLEGKPDIEYQIESYPTLQAVRNASNDCRAEVEQFVKAWRDEFEMKPFDDYTYGEVMRHVIAHEIHHIGQLSI
ncbi:DinB family protein [Salsuginibacillus kocurii]|uniref:DinB family protein n=1 Tax=Salsuginibacillus kocurii TaxID=427078 RepID=UPI00036C90C9|nr:DinB family protein [Salsuginibacillus kocurii]